MFNDAALIQGMVAMIVRAAGRHVLNDLKAEK